MKFLLRLLIIISVALSLLEAFADGDWSSGGGYIPSNKDNPWFINKTAKNVSYCINIDEENFGLTKAEALDVVKRSINYWLLNFKDQESTIPHTYTYAMGAQQFEYYSVCSPNIDLRFQLGRLEDEDNKPSIKEILKGAIASIIRLDYDRKKLRGKGFVYVVPEKGPNALSSNGDLLEQYWTSNDPFHNRLYTVLTHELGHIFGVIHVETGHMPFMSKTYPFKIISKGSPFSESKFLYQLPLYFKGFSEWDNTRHYESILNKSGQEYFSLTGGECDKNNDNNILIKVSDIASKIETKIYCTKSNSLSEIGKIIWNKQNQTGYWYTNYGFISVIPLDKEQEVVHFPPPIGFPKIWSLIPHHDYTDDNEVGILIPQNINAPNQIILRRLTAAKIELKGLIKNADNPISLRINFFPKEDHE